MPPFARDEVESVEEKKDISELKKRAYEYPLAGPTGPTDPYQFEWGDSVFPDSL